MNDEYEYSMDHLTEAQDRLDPLRIDRHGINPNDCAEAIRKHVKWVEKANAEQYAPDYAAAQSALGIMAWLGRIDSGLETIAHALTSQAEMQRGIMEMLVQIVPLVPEIEKAAKAAADRLTEQRAREIDAKRQYAEEEEQEYAEEQEDA